MDYRHCAGRRGYGHDNPKGLVGSHVDIRGRPRNLRQSYTRGGNLSSDMNMEHVPRPPAVAEIKKSAWKRA